MASIKLSLDTRRAILNNEYPLIISVSHKGKNLSIPTGCYLQEKSFDIHKCIVLLGNRALNEQEIFFVHLKKRIIFVSTCPPPFP
jgi:hypothetical protein